MNTIRKRRQAIISQKSEDPYIYGSDLEWEVGVIILSTGEIDSSYTTYMSTTNYISIRKRELNFISSLINNNNVNHYCYIAEYNENKTIIRRPTLVSDGIKQLYYLHDTCRYIKISFGYAASTEELMTLEEAQLLTIEKIRLNFPYKHRTWDDLFYCIDNGILQQNYILGELIPIDLNTGGKLDMQIVGFNLDTYEENTDKVPVSFISKQLYKTTHRMNPALNPSSAPYDEGTGVVGGWGKSEMRTYLQETIFPLIPENIKNRIVNVKKYSNSWTTSAAQNKNNLSYDKIWIPSCREVGISQESSGPTYSGVFTGNTARKKTQYGNTTVRQYFLRTAYFTFSSQYFYAVSVSGTGNTTKATVSSYFPIGFCIG